MRLLWNMTQMAMPSGHLLPPQPPPTYPFSTVFRLMTMTIYTPVATSVEMQNLSLKMAFPQLEIMPVAPTYLC